MQLILLGMHRSGTSALARILNLMGCYFGSEDVSAGVGYDNPKGFWERLDVVELNNLILNAAGGSWWDMEKFDSGSIKGEELDDIDRQIGNIILKLDAHRPWFIKDPRLGPVLFFWLSRLENPLFLLATRSPFQVARSLEKRNGIPVDYGLMLWEYYTLITFVHLGRQPFIPLSYESFLRDPYPSVLQLYRDLVEKGVSGLRLPDRGQVESYIDPMLNHSSGEDDPARLSPPRQSLHRACSTGKAPLIEPGRLKDLQKAMGREKKRGEWVEKLLIISGQDYFKKVTRLELKKKNSELEKLIGEMEEQNQTLKTHVSEIEDYNEELKRHIGVLDDSVDTLKAHNSDLRAHSSGQDRRIAALENRLRALVHSRLIGLVTFFYRVLGLGQRGLAAETDRIRDLLEHGEDYPQETERVYSPRGGGRLALLIRLFTIALHNPVATLKAFRPHRLKQVATLIFSGDLDKQTLPPAGSDDQGVQSYRSVVGSMSASAQDLPAMARELIESYNLPCSSSEGHPDPPTEVEVDTWAENVFSMEKTLPPPAREPAASIIIPVHNNLRFTMACLESVLRAAGRDDYEIIIADDASTDDTPRIFGGKSGRIRYLRSDMASGFNENCRRAADQARGHNLVFLNNDTVVLQDWLKELIDLLEEDPSVGLAGSCLLYPENLLQEAGGIIFADGSGWNYGRFQPPDDPCFSYLRDCDYTSAASLAIPAALWRELNGFDPRFSPAYYEDTDLAFRVRKKGKKVVYQPLSRLIHFEGVSHGKSEQSGIKRFQALNRDKFVKKWQQTLDLHGPGHDPARHVGRGLKGRVLVVDATTPTPDQDSGSMDIFNYMQIIKNLGYHVTFIPQNIAHAGRYTRDLQRIGVECLYAPWIYSAREAVKRYASRADMVFLSRFYVAAPLVDIVRRVNPAARIIFDTVDIHFIRESREAELLNSTRLRINADKTRRRELEVIEKSDLTLLRSNYELDVIGKLLPAALLRIMPIVREIPGRVGGGWEDRSDIVFIGGFLHPPNLDAVKFFVREVWPHLRRASFPGRLVIAGSNMPPEVEALGAEDIDIRGFVPDLASLFNSCRLTIAPLRYGAGVKGKVVSSLSYGVPCVGTSVAAEGSGFENGHHMLIEDDPLALAGAVEKLYNNRDLWEKLSAGGLEYCRRYYSIEAVQRMMETIFREQIS